MSPPPHPPLLDGPLHGAARRYRLPALPSASAQVLQSSPSTALAIAIEQTRVATAQAPAAEAAARHLFIESLARMLREAMRAQGGDPAYQAMVLAQQAPQVREYTALLTHAEKDQRQVRAAVNAIAHPAKPQHCDPGPQREALGHLHAALALAHWSDLAGTARQLLAMPEVPRQPPLQRSLAGLLDGAALARLQRTAALAPDATVQQYLALRDLQGPRSGTPAAAVRGHAAQQRGAAVEALAARVIEALAQRLSEAEGAPGAYRAVTSMRVPSAIPGSAERAKSEWDVVLLRQAAPAAGTAGPLWDLCLLVEVKASVDAAATDFPRLLRGLTLLAHADKDGVYAFATQQGEVLLRGAPLSALGTDGANLAHTVLYCSDAPAEAAPHLLSAASRMQLLSAPQSLAFAGALAQGRQVDAQELDPVWQQLRQAPQWASVLHQYPAMCRVRELMLHVADLSAAMGGSSAAA